MNTVDTLNHYLRATERRLRVFALSRGASVTALVALGLTVALAFIANVFTFAPFIVLISRLLLFLSLALALAFFGVLPLMRLNRRNAARRIEQKYPEFEQRLLTFAERRDTADNPFIALLASETAEVAQRAQPGRLAASQDSAYLARFRRGGGVHPDMADHGGSGISGLWRLFAVGRSAETRHRAFVQHRGDAR